MKAESELKSVQEKREIGAFYTEGNPFSYSAFKNWVSRVDANRVILEPFAGKGHICKLLSQSGHEFIWDCFDIDQSLKRVSHRDCLRDFPKGYQACITNPPYLSIHFAKRKGIITEAKEYHGMQSLYQVAIQKALSECDFVAMIIPESFITSGLFRERLAAIISLPERMFTDTDMPVCLALWVPEQVLETEIWRQNEYLGPVSGLLDEGPPSGCSHRISFNRVDGNLGLRAIDNSRERSIAFCEPDEIPVHHVKHSARLLTRIQIDGTDKVEEIIKEANRRLDAWRLKTEDLQLTAFKGVRKDGRFRRRLDYASARRFLSEAICNVEGHEGYHEIRGSSRGD
jgi:hypothetical protein